MNRHPVRRAAAAFGLYIFVFLGLAVLQFSRRTGFTLNVGSMTVSGTVEKSADPSGQARPAGVDRAVAGALSIFFGGMEFRVSEEDGLVSVAANGTAIPTRPVSIRDSAGTLRVLLADGSELAFSTAFVGGAETLRAEAAFAEGRSELRLPYRPLRSSRTAELEDGRPAVLSGGATFAFARAALDAERRVAVLKKRSPAFSYGKILPKKAFSPSDMVLPAAADSAAYERAVERWKDQSYASWDRAMAGAPDEETVAVYVAESARRGAYRSAVAAAPKAFVDGNARGFRTTTFFGRLDDGLRSLAAAERENLGRIARLSNDRSLDLFSEQDLVAYLSVRASRSISDEVVAFAKALDPSSLTLAASAGVLEARADWAAFRKGEENPFDRLVDQARFVAGAALKRAGDAAVFAVQDDKADPLFNIRLGRALERSASSEADRAWAEVGRSLVLSAIASADTSGSLPAELRISPEGAQDAGKGRVPAFQAYRLVSPGSALPREVPLPAEPGAWAWTSAAVSAAREGDVLDIAATFPVGETHYLLVRGIKPFQKIQLYGIDFRTDPRFERYDSSGWAYSAADQTLLLKMKHKAGTEHARIYF